MRRESFIFMLGVFVCSWAGELNGQWFQRNSGTAAALTDVVMLDSATAFAVTRGRSILRTTDAGTTWFDLTAPLSCVMPWNAVSFLDSGNGIAVGDYGVFFAIVTGGRAGGCRYIQSRQNCLSAFHVSAGNIYVGADSGWIFHSLDSGKTWTSEKISEWPIRSIFASRKDSVAGIAIYALTSHSICVETGYPSSSWHERDLEAFQQQGAEAFDGQFARDGGTGFIVGFGGDSSHSPVILRKLPSATLWNSIPCGNDNNGPLFSIAVPSADIAYACGKSGMIIKSTDGGDSWSQYTIPQTFLPVPDLKAIAFFDEKHGFAVGESGTILYTSNGGLTGVDRQGPVIPEDFLLEQNYPNPFNPTTTIRYRLSEAGHTWLAVYDVLGRQVTTLVNARQGPGSYSVRFDASGLPGGVYLYRLSAGTRSQTKKLVLIK